jgi:zinc protease
MRTLAVLGLTLLLSSCVVYAEVESQPKVPMTKSSEAPAATAAKPAAEGNDILPYKATETTLGNGLRVIIVPTGMPNLVSLQIPVQTGSRNEVEPGKTGFAHFFEHMMFRGTDKFPPADYEAIITRAGARQNAYTTDDYTNYHITFAKEDLDRILEIEGDRFQRLKYTDEQFRTEARAVLGEYNKNFANPAVKLDEVLCDAAYTTHTYKHTTMGFLADIQAMPEQGEYAKVFFDRWYRPEYAAVMLVGDVDPATAIPLVEKHFGSWKPGSFKVEIPQEPEPQGPKYTHVPWPSPTAPLVTVAFHGPRFSESEKDQVALDLLCELHFGGTSELYRKLVLEEQKVDELSYYVPGSVDSSLTQISAQLRDAKDALYVRDQILATCARARSASVDPTRLAAAKANNRYGTSRALDNTEAVGSILARFVRFRRSFDTFNNLFRLYDAVTPADAQAAGERYFRDNRLVVATLCNGDMPAGIDKAPSLAALAPSAPLATKAKVVELANPSRQLTFKLQFVTGSADDPAGKEGLAALTAALMAGGGSAERKIEEIEEALFPIAGSFGAFVDREMTTFNGSIHADNLERYFDMVLPQLLTPGWREEDFARIQQQVRNALVQDLRTNNDEELGKEALQASLFAGTGYGHPAQGTVAGIDSITLDECKRFAATHFTQAHLVVGIAGDLPAAGKQRLLSALGGLPQGEASLASRPMPRALSGLTVDVIEKSTRATAISMGHGIEVFRGHPDFAALYLARTWLGEHRSSMSHLYQRIREVRGMNYGDYAYIEAFRNGGSSFFPGPNQARRSQLFEIWIRPVAPENAHHAIKIALHEYERLVAEGLPSEDFERVREYLTKNVFVMTASQSAQLGYALDSHFYGIGEYTQYMRDALSKLTVEQVNDAMRHHFKPKDLHIVCVTADAKGLADKLAADGASTIQYDAQKPKELLDEDARIGARKLGLDASRVRVVPVTSVFER